MRLAVLFAAVMALASCENGMPGAFAAFSDTMRSTKDTANREYYPDDELLVAARVQFQERNFGRSYTMFKKALDVYPDDPAAWLGFAASADMLRRFDQSDYAYRKLQPVVGNRIEFLNNFGYSQLLRGNLRAARTYFVRAYELDPSNEITANNLELLRNSVSYPKRAPGDLRGI